MASLRQKTFSQLIPLFTLSVVLIITLFLSPAYSTADQLKIIRDGDNDKVEHNCKPDNMVLVGIDANELPKNKNEQLAHLTWTTPIYHFSLPLNNLKEPN